MNTQEAIEASGATYRQLDHWARGGLLRPVQRMEGSGHKRTWPDVEVRVAGILARLTAVGMLPQQAIDAARALATEPGQTYHLGGGVHVALRGEYVDEEEAG